MTHPTYSQQYLQHKSIARLKQIYSQIACTIEVTDKRCKDAWITAIADYQANKVQKLTPAAPDEQTAAQAELDGFIASQAQAIAPEPLTTIEINSNHYEVYSGKQLIAYIAYDHNELVTQRWLVMVNGEEKFRDTTVARCQRFIEWHHKDGTLNNSQLPSRNSQLNAITKSEKPYACNDSITNPLDNCELRTANCELLQVPQISELSFYDQEAFVNRELVAGIFYDHDNYKDLYWRVIINDKEIFRDTTSARCHSYVKQQYQQGTLPVQEPFIEEPCTTGNEIMAQIFNECEKYGFEILDDGIYNGDRNLGEVRCMEGCWWVMRTGESQQISCNSALDAVWWLSRVDVLPTAELSLDELHLLEKAAVSDNQKFIAA